MHAIADIFSGVDTGLLLKLIAIGWMLLQVWSKIDEARARRKTPASVVLSAPVPPMPSPIIVQEAVQYVEFREFQKLMHKVERIEEGMPAMETRNREDLDALEERLSERGEVRVVKIHDRINELAAEQSKGLQLATDTEKTMKLLVSVMRDRKRRVIN